MKSTFHVQNKDEIDLVFKMKGEEVILSTKSFSRWGNIELAHAIELAQYAKIQKIRTVFEIDRLFSETELKELKETNLQFLNEFEAVRVKDAGVLFYLLEQSKEIKIQLIVETGHHNNLALSFYQNNKFNNQIERLILSSELSLEELKIITQEIRIPVELLVLGPILLFDTPRSLLAPLVHPDEKKERLEAIGKSEESPHKGFPVIENKFGTLMFHTKDICLLKFMEDVKLSGVTWIRLDLRLEKKSKIFSFLTDYWMSPSEDKLEILSENWTRDWMRGFFHVNKTDVLFSKLKNTNLQREDSDYLGEIIDVTRDKAIVIMVRGSELKLGSELVIVNPHGKEKEMTLKNLRNSQLENVDIVKKDHLAILPYVSGAIARSQVYYKSRH